MRSLLSTLVPLGWILIFSVLIFGHYYRHTYGKQGILLGYQTITVGAVLVFVGYIIHSVVSEQKSTPEEIDYEDK